MAAGFYIEEAGKISHRKLGVAEDSEGQTVRKDIHLSENPAPLLANFAYIRETILTERCPFHRLVLQWQMLRKMHLRYHFQIPAVLRGCRFFCNIRKMKERKVVTLLLEDGTRFEGFSFGYDGPSDGEVVFSTAMVGYPESLTDPSYSGQILCVTYPLIGNYGVPSEGVDKAGISLNFESERIWVRGLVISDYSFDYSHWDAVKSLDEWLKEQRIPGISGIDTRALTTLLREKGSMLGKIIPAGTEEGEFDVKDPNLENQIAIVSCKEPIIYGDGPKTVVMVDCGVKHNILRCFMQRGVKVIRVPWDYDFSGLEYDGLFISNGPGNPEFCVSTVEHLRKAMEGEKPIFGICMGNQLLARAAGADTYKLKYGHRSHNQPVRMIGTNRCFITSQNHGFAVDETKLGSDWEPWFTNMNDGTNEGIRHKKKPFCSVQFHPEASSGPTDTDFLFDEFISKL